VGGGGAEGKKSLGLLWIVGRKILKRDLKIWNEILWTEYKRLRIGRSGWLWWEKGTKLRVLKHAELTYLRKYFFL